jgi:hypothetical protein
MTRIIAAITLAVTVLSTSAHAQHVSTPPQSRVESETRVFAATPAIEGYVYNERYDRIANVRLKVEIVDGASAVIDEATEWVIGDVCAGKRGYFIVPLKRRAPAYRISVSSFDIVVM